MVFFFNKNNVSVSEPLDGTIENLLRRDCSDKMLEKALRELTISQVLRLLLNSH